MLGLLGLKVSELHGALTQEQRLQNVKNFKSLEVPVLICTDLAARGLDIPKIELVINYDMPKHLKSICIEWKDCQSWKRRDIYHICWRIKPRKSYCQICHRQRQRCSKTVDWKQAEETNKLLESKESVIDEVLEEEKRQRSCFVPKWNSPRHPTLSNTNKKYIHVQKELGLKVKSWNSSLNMVRK